MAKVKLKGKAFWARVYEGNHDEFGGKEFYKITVALDDESWSKFNKSKMKLKPKAVSSDDDTLGVTFRRDVEAKSGIGKNGKKWTLGGGPPVVVDSDGDDFDELIGNGSLVEVLIETYQSKMGTGHRLEAVKVIEHIPYESPVEDEEDEVEEEKPVEKKTKKKLPF